MSNYANNTPIEIADNIFWVGINDQANGLHCSPYLIIDGSEGVLIDPGSPLDFEYVLANVTSLIPLENIKYVILQHQDPDLCASTPLFEKQGLQAEIATHWRTSNMIKYYGITSPFYIVNENRLQLTFGNNRTLIFYPTPYLHFAGAITTYDPKSKILFSSDLFGAFSNNWRLFADEVDNANYESYLESMKTFHEHYMPSNDIIRPVMEGFSKMDITMIAPQHGSIIRKHIPKHIAALRDLECGSFLKPIKKELSKMDGFTGLCNVILKRYYSTFPVQDVMDIFRSTEIKIDESTGLIVDYNSTGRELWQQLFQIIYIQKGLSWLTFIEPLVCKLSSEYELSLPVVFKSTVLELEQEKHLLTSENQKLKEMNERLEFNLSQANDTLLKCPITKLYNETVLKQYLIAECNSLTASGCLLMFSIDNILTINLTYGSATGDDTLKNVAYILEQQKEDSHIIFKMNGPNFACYIGNINREEAIAVAEKIRYTVSISEIMIEPITLSIGIACFEELSTNNFTSPEQLASAIYSLARQRCTLAKNKGMNLVCAESSPDLENTENHGKILIIDTDETNLTILTRIFHQYHFTILTAQDGDTALQLIESEIPDIVISEVMLPKADGFMIRERMQMLSISKNTPFILVSFQKNIDTIQRALALDIEHYFQKPYILSELTGIVIHKMKQQHKLVHTANK